MSGEPRVIPWSPRVIEPVEESAAELVLDSTEPMEAPLHLREAALDTLQKPELDSQAPAGWQGLVEEGQRLDAAGDLKAAALAYLSALSQIDQSSPPESLADVTQRLTVLCQENGWGPLAELSALSERERPLAIAGMESSANYLSMGLLQASAEDCYESIGKAPNYLPLQTQLARVYEAQGEHSMAISKLLSIIHVYSLRGEAFRAMQVAEQILETATAEEQTQALGTMRQIREQFPDDERLRTSLAQAYFRLGQIDLVVAEFAQLAALYESRGDYSQAIPLYNAMLQLSSGDIEVRERLCQAYLSAGLNTEARDELETLAEEQLSRGMTEGASRSLRLALEKCHKGERRRALRLRERLVVLNPHDAQLHRELISAYLKSGRASQALAEARSWADTSWNADTREEAREALSQVLQLDPWNADARQKLSVLNGEAETSPDFEQE